MSNRYEVTFEVTHRIIVLAESATHALSQAKDHVPDIEWTQVDIERCDR